MKGSTLLALLAGPWLIAMYAMTRMTLTAIQQMMQDSELTLGWLFGGSYVLEKPYRKYFLVFGIAIGVDIGIAGIVIILSLTGRIDPASWTRIW